MLSESSILLIYVAEFNMRFQSAKFPESILREIDNKSKMLVKSLVGQSEWEVRQAIAHFFQREVIPCMNNTMVTFDQFRGIKKQSHDTAIDKIEFMYGEIDGFSQFIQEQCIGTSNYPSDEYTNIYNEVIQTLTPESNIILFSIPDLEQRLDDQISDMKSRNIRNPTFIKQELNEFVHMLISDHGHQGCHGCISF